MSSYDLTEAQWLSISREGFERLRRARRSDLKAMAFPFIYGRNPITGEGNARALAWAGRISDFDAETKRLRHLRQELPLDPTPWTTVNKHTLNTDGVNRLTFSTGKVFMTKATDEDGWAHSQKVYEDASAEYPESFPLAARADAEQIKAWSEARHMSATHAVYLAGVAAGAKQVQFHDEKLEKEIAQIPLNVLDRAYSRIAVEMVKRGPKFERGLKKARSAIAKLRQEFASGAVKL